MVDPVTGFALSAGGKAAGGLGVSLAKSSLFIPRVAWRVRKLARSSGTKIGFWAVTRVLFDKALRRCLVEDVPLTTDARAAMSRLDAVIDVKDASQVLEAALRRAVAGQLSPRDWQERQHVEAKESMLGMADPGDRHRLPRPVAEDLSGLSEPVAQRLAAHFAAAEERKQLLQDWLAQRPNWLPEESRIDEWLAHLAFYIGEHVLGIEWAERALAAGASPRAYWKVRIAATSDEIKDPVAYLSDVNDHPLVIAALHANSLANRRSALTEWTPISRTQQELHADILLQQIVEGGEPEAAFRRGRALFEEEGFQTAGLHALQAHRGIEPVTVAGLIEARQLALDIRDAQRATGVPSATAVRASVRLSLLLGDDDAAMRLTLPAPEGEATFSEAGSPRIIAERILLLLAEGDIDHARALLSSSTPHPVRLQLAACEAEQAGDNPRASELLGEAIDATEDWSDKADLVFNLATRGVRHPFIDQLRPENEAVADELELIADVFRDVPSALQKLKSDAVSSPRAAQMLARYYEKRDDKAGLLRTIEHAARTWGTPRDHLRAAILRYQRGDYPKAAEHAGYAANRTMRVLDATAREALQLQLACAHQLRDWDAAVTAATSLVELDPADAGSGWSLIYAYHRAGDEDRAFESWKQSPQCQVPRNPGEASLWLHLFQIYGSRMAPLSEALALGTAFHGDEQVRRLVVGAALLAPVTAPTVSVDIARMADEFSADFPDNAPLIQTVTLPSEEAGAEEIIEALMLALGGPEEPDDIDRGFKAGTFPVGLAFHIKRRNFTEGLILQRKYARFAGTLSPSNGETMQRARVGVAVDTSALLTMAMLPEAAAEIVSSAMPHRLSSVTQIRDAHESGRSIRDSKGHFYPGTRNSGPVFFVVDEDETSERARLHKFISEHLKVADRSDAPPIEHEAFSISEMRGPWCGAMERAADADVPLWCDDASTRLFAQELGIPAFGTPELVTYLREQSLLDGDQADAIEAAMIHQYVVGVPFTSRVYELALALDGGRVGGTAMAIIHGGRHHFKDKIALIFAAMEAVADKDPESLQAWANVLARFLVGITDDKGAVSNLGLVVLKVLSSNWASSHTVTFALRGVRAAAEDRWYPCLREGLAAASSILQEILAPDLAASYLIGLTTGLTEEERKMVLEIILRPAES